MRRFVVQEFQAAGLDVRSGEILVPTEIGDPVRGPLKCPAAPFVDGSLRRRGRSVRLVTVPQFQDPQFDGDGDGAVLFVAICQQREDATVALAAAASPADQLAVAVARSAVEEWAAVFATRRLLLTAGPWCEGAQRALAAAEQAVASAEGRSVHVYGQFAATVQAVGALADRGAVFSSSPSDIPSEGVIVFAAHGVPPEVCDEAAARGLEIVDATCPLVAMAQSEARKVAGRGDHLVLIGQPEYPAAAAIAGHAGDAAAIVATAAGIAALHAPDPRRISYLLQPGIPLENSAPVAAALRSRFPAVRRPHPDGFCYAATDRADSIRLMASRADLVLILGAESADARQISRLAIDCGTRAQTIAHPSEITAAMLAGTASLGIAESTSARTGLAAEVIAALAGLGPLSVVRRQIETTIDGQSAMRAGRQAATAARRAQD